MTCLAVSLDRGGCSKLSVPGASCGKGGGRGLRCCLWQQSAVTERVREEGVGHTSTLERTPQNQMQATTLGELVLKRRFLVFDYAARAASHPNDLSPGTSSSPTISLNAKQSNGARHISEVSY